MRCKQNHFPSFKHATIEKIPGKDHISQFGKAKYLPETMTDRRSKKFQTLFSATARRRFAFWSDIRPMMEQFPALEKAKRVLPLCLGSFERHLRNKRANKSSKNLSRFLFQSSLSRRYWKESNYRISEDYQKSKGFINAHGNTWSVF